MALDRTTVRMLEGIGLVLGIAAALVFLYAMILPSKADIERAAEALDAERRPQRQRDPHFAWPEVTRWHFVTHLPIVGKVNRYRWRAQGEFACSLDRDRDRMVNFRLDTPNAAEPIELVSPLALFDKKARTLSSEVATQVTFSWGTVRSKKMRLELDTVNAFFDEDVIVDVKDRATGGLISTDTGGDGETGNGAGNAEGKDAKTKPAKKKPLRITAQHFEIRSAEDKGIFTGNVVARDGSGTIWADTMIVQYYSDEEKVADPARTGMKHVTCIGHVRIDQKTEQAKCEEADYDIAANVITLKSTKTTRVLYRKDDGEEKHQILADTVIIDRNDVGKTRFVGNVEVQDFSETRESFFGKSKPDEENDDDGASRTTDEQ